MVTRRPRARRRCPRLEAVSPLPSEEATPPVTKMCLVCATDFDSNSRSGRSRATGDRRRVLRRGPPPDPAARPLVGPPPPTGPRERPGHAPAGRFRRSARPASPAGTRTAAGPTTCAVPPTSVATIGRFASERLLQPDRLPLPDGGRHGDVGGRQQIRDVRPPAQQLDREVLTRNPLLQNAFRRTVPSDDDPDRRVVSRPVRPLRRAAAAGPSARPAARPRPPGRSPLSRPAARGCARPAGPGQRAGAPR